MKKISPRTVTETVSHFSVDREGAVVEVTRLLCYYITTLHGSVVTQDNSVRAGFVNKY